MCLGVLVSLVILGYLIILLFETKKINVSGTTYSSSQEVQDWVQSDPYASNTLYILWKYNQKDIVCPPAIEAVTVKMQSPWEITVSVTEKSFSGRVDFGGSFLYFDRQGVASLESAEQIEGVPYIEGMTLDEEKVRLGEVLPVTDAEVFDKINTITALLKAAELTPDKISCEDSGLTLHFGGVRVQMGIGSYEEKVAQAKPILSKLQELYADRTGVLHLENYTSADSSIRFVPDPATTEEAAE